MSTAANLDHNHDHDHDHDHDAGAADKNCPNCEAVVSGHFCANCGQEAYLHHASTREFLHEFIGHYVALEGKLWGTITRLLFRPGQLTNEYIRGRRVRFVQPLRLYLTLSLLFFALMKFTAGFDPGVGEDDDSKAELATTQAAVDTAGKIAKAQAKVAEKLKAAGPQVSAEDAKGKAAAEAAIAAMEEDNGRHAAEVAEAAKAADAAKPAAAKDATAVSAANAPAKASAEAAPASADADKPKAKHGVGEVNVDKDDFDEWLSGWPRLQHQWHVFEELPREEQKKVFKDGFYHYAPYAIFCLMPVFALFLKILYIGSGRRFGEHLLFALHTNAFAYFMFTAMVLSPFKPLDLILWCWLLGYLPWAMRRVYHRGRFGTFCRWVLLMLFYLMSIGLALLFSMGMGIMTVGH
jgi:hypothetical protein